MRDSEAYDEIVTYPVFHMCVCPISFRWPCLSFFGLYRSCIDFRVLAENLVGLVFLCSVSLYKTNPTPRKIVCCGKKVARNAPFNLYFLGLGWPWVGEFIGFIIISSMCMPTQHNSVNRTHPSQKLQRLVGLSFFFPCVTPCPK